MKHESWVKSELFLFYFTLCKCESVLEDDPSFFLFLVHYVVNLVFELLWFPRLLIYFFKGVLLYYRCSRVFNSMYYRHLAAK